MRIFLSLNDQSGVRRTIRMSIQDCQNTTKLMRLISAKINVKRQYCIIKLKTQQMNIRIVQGWYLDIYPFKNGSWIYVDILYQQMKKQSNLFSKIKKLDQIQEQLQLEFDEENQKNIPDPKLSFQSQKSQYDWDRYYQQNLQAFLSAVRQQDLLKMSNILKSQPQVKEQYDLMKMMKKKNQFLLNQLGQCGRAAIHWAIQQRNLDIVQFLLIKSCDPNIVSLDQYTPLQLAISVRSIHIIQTLLLHPKIDINKITNKGSALHLAVKSEELKLVKKILQTGIDTELQDNDKKLAIQLCNNDEIHKYMKQNPSKKYEKIPYISRGNVYLISGIVSMHKERLLLVNPFTNQIYIFKDKQLDIKMYLDKIKNVQYINQKGWFMKNKYHYFQIQGQVKKFIFGFRNQQICNHWIKKVKQNAKYCKDKLYKKKISLENQLIQNIDDLNNHIQIHKRKKKVSSFKDNNNNIILDIKPQKQEDQDSYKTKETDSQELTSSQDSQVYQNDLRNSQLLGSIIGTSNIFSQKKIYIDNKQDKIQSISFKDFQFLKLLGNGSFGKVFLAKNLKNTKNYALKVLNKKKLMVKKQLKYAIGQANILKKVDNPFIIKLHYSFQTPSNLYIALDYCPHGDLAEILSDRDFLHEREARFYVAQLILAIQYLHSKKIIYRDLKPENILIGPDGYIRLTDFGLSKQNMFSMSFCGSPAYLSPQMLQKKGVGLQSDIYGIGCVLYQMIVGQPPFFDDDINKLFENIKNARIKYPSHVSKLSKSLINSLLERNVKKRLGVQDINQIKKHEFFNNFDWKKLQNLQMKPPADIIDKMGQIGQLQVFKKQNFVDSDYDNPSNMMNRIRGFTFIRQINM